MASPQAMPEIDADAFFSVPDRGSGGCALVGAQSPPGCRRPFALLRVSDGEVG